MIVLDASVVLDIVTAVAAGRSIADQIAQTDDDFVAPEVIDLEVLQAVRRLLRLAQLSEQRARDSVALLRDLPFTRMSHEPLVPRIWELRNNLTAYDAAYIALAELLGAPVWTRDRKFMRAAGHRAAVIVV